MKSNYTKDMYRLKSNANNNSANSSHPPSTDQKGTKKADEYNSRKKTGKKQGAQHGHKGKTLILGESAHC